MVLFSHKTWLTTLTLLLTLWVTGCSSHVDDPAPWEGEIYLSLSVHTVGGGDTQQSRAETQGTFDFELPDLDTEKMNSLRIIIVKTGNATDKDTIKYNSYEPLSSPGSSISGLRYKVEFNTDYDIFLIANEEGLPSDIQQQVMYSLLPGVTYEGELDNIAIGSSTIGKPIIDNTTGDRKNVPMTERFHIETPECPQVVPEKYVLVVEKNLFVTRAASKFTFNFYKSEDWDSLDPDETKLLEVKAIKISGLGQNQYLIPNGTVYDPPKGLVSNQEYGGRLITDFNLPDGSTSNGDYIFGVIPFKVSQLNVADKGKPYTFAPELYFPESKGLAIPPTEEVPDPAGGQFTCSLSFDGETFTEPVALPNLSSLPRNTHVVVNVTIAPQTVKIVVKVVPYNVVTLDPIFGLPDPNDQNPGGESGDESGDETK